MRAQFYSVIAVLLVLPIVLFITQYVHIQSTESGIYENIVADQMHQVKRSVERDFQKAIVTSGKRALLAGDDYVVMSSNPLEDAVAAIEELMETGTIEGNESMLMVNNTVSNWTSKISAIETNFLTGISFSGLSVSTYDSFRIKASGLLNISVTDPLGTAEIKRTNVEYEQLIPVEGAEDPLFTLMTNGALTRSVSVSPHPYRAKRIVSGGVNSSGSCSGEVTFSKGDCDSKILVAENLSGVIASCFSGLVIEESANLSGSSECFVTGNSSAVESVSEAVSFSGYGRIYIDDETRSAWHLPIRDEIDNGYYFPGEGPDFLKRLEGDLSGSSGGMETFVNLPAFQSYGLPIDEDSVSVAYKYFGDEEYNGHPIRGLQTWFRLDKNFSERYGLAGLCEGC